MWCLTGMLDLLRRKKKDGKPILNTVHYHYVAEEIPFFFAQIERSLVVFLEEDIEYYQMVSKMLGKRSGNINYLDAMRTGEQVKDLQAMEYALGVRGEQNSRGQDAKLFSPSNIPNLLVFGCAYLLTPTWERNLFRLLSTVLVNLHSEHTFVYESEECKEHITTWATSKPRNDEYLYHLDMYRQRVAGLYPQYPDKPKIKKRGCFQRSKKGWLVAGLCGTSETQFKDSAQYPHLQLPCLCQGCKDGFKNAPNKELFGQTHARTFETCICRRLPVVVFLVGEGSRAGTKKLSGTSEFVCVKCYLAALRKFQVAAVEGVRNLSSPGTQVKEGDLLSIEGIFPENLDIVLYFGDKATDIEFEPNRKQFSFACPPPQSTRTRVDLTVVASLQWGVYANSCVLSKGRQERHGPLYLEEQRIVLRRFPEHVAYCKVSINKVVPATFSTAGCLAEVHGNFATASEEVISVTCNEKECELRSHSSRKLVMMLTTGTGVNRPLCVTVKEQSTGTVVSSTVRNCITYKPPKITGFKGGADDLSTTNPLVVVTSGGASITVCGSDFGDEENVVSVRLGETPCTVLNSNHDVLECRVPRGVGYLPSITVSVDGQVTSAQAPLKYSPPAITSGDKRVIAGRNFTIHGLHFGHDPRTVICLWSKEKQMAIPIHNVSDNELVCSTAGLPLGEGNQGAFL
ncbi:hypothetical protein CYMTET_47425 [Cymbomonas tetramitiformis]|uniref:IPT/TIG domain-containing protein n=1 Tax=Cymbomonas tetramitiformis TaxID=36881 RepID=A0AAE0EWP1_9CHLO|nr:hypothetical protein CYMTET_47425 [Cymbomonas tetramitiformis]